MKHFDMVFKMAFMVLVLMTTGCGDNFRTVKIGNQVWMAENLNVTRFSNGDPIPEARTKEEWQLAGKEGKPSWCFYLNNKTYGKKYGKLYNWYAVADPRGLAPTGWHIPDDAEWDQLVTQLGGAELAGTKMKSIDGWPKNENGTNESGYTGLPAGGRGPSGAFGLLGTRVDWWSSTEAYTYTAWSRGLSYLNGAVWRNSNSKKLGLSVRCIRN